MKLSNMVSLSLSVVRILKLVLRNVAYNAVCLFEKLVQVLDAKDKGLDRLCIVLHQHLVEYGSDVHCGAARCTGKLAGMK